MRMPWPETCRGRELRRGREQLSALCGALQAGSRASWSEKDRRFRHAAALAASLSPYQVLARGLCHGGPGADGKIRQADQLAPGDTIRLVAAHRRAQCLVTAVEETDESTQNI